MDYKELIKREIEKEFPYYYQIKRWCDLASTQEDIRDYGYSPQSSEVDYLAKNDFELFKTGYKFAKGELDWYLSAPDISSANKQKIKIIKREQGI